MANYTQGDTRPVLQSADLTTYQGNGSLVLDSRRTRPLWFDGRFLAARDFAREQNYFLQREADLARAPGFGAMDGLLVSIASSNGQGGSATAILIQAGSAITPAGEIVTVPDDLTVDLGNLVDEENLDVQFGIAPAPAPSPNTRTGLYLVALKPVQFASNPITSYPTSIQGQRSTHDGDLVEATAIVLVPYPSPSNNASAANIQASLARQILVTGKWVRLPDSLLPLAMLSLQNGAVVWADSYMVRRETGVEYTGLRFGLTDPAVQQAFLLDYDTQLQQAVNSFVRQNLPARFAATDYFQALPPAGRFPLASINTDGFTQNFFPAQIDVRLSIVPDDELPALIQDSMSLPPIDLTLDASAYTNLTIFALVPVPRVGFAASAAGLPSVPVTTILPRLLNNRMPLDLLQFYRGATGITQPSGTDNTSWQAAFGTQTYGYYVRRRSSASPVAFQVPPPPPVIISLSPPFVVAGGPAFTLEIIGADFTNEVAIEWNSAAIGNASFLNSELLQVNPVLPAYIAQPGSVPITVKTEFQSSNAVDFTITPAPAITGISQSSAVSCDPGFTLIVTGTNFTNATQVTWNGADIQTTFVSAAELEAMVTPDLLTSPGTFSVGVSGMPSTTTPVSFTVAAGFVLSGVSPSPIVLQTFSRTLTLNGCGFNANTQVYWNTIPLLNPTVVSANQMTVIVIPSIIGPGVVSVMVKNGTTPSNVVTVTVTAS